MRRVYIRYTIQFRRDASRLYGYYIPAEPPGGGGGGIFFFLIRSIGFGGGGGVRG